MLVHVLALSDVVVTLTPVDGNSFATAGAASVRITQLPSFGTLYQTSDGISQGAPITAIPSLVTNSNFSVMYVNTAPTAPYSGLAVMYTDSFLWQPQLTYNGTVFNFSVISWSHNTQRSTRLSRNFLTHAFLWLSLVRYGEY